MIQTEQKKKATSPAKIHHPVVFPAGIEALDSRRTLLRRRGSAAIALSETTGTI